MELWVGALAVLLFRLVVTEGQHHEVPMFKEAPEWLKLCRRKDPYLNDCLKNTFQSMFPALAAGIPEINVDRFEPLYLERLSLTKGHGPVVITGSFYNILVHGPSNATATFAALDTKTNRMELGVFLPEIRAEGQYDLKGKILLLPLLGAGAARVNLKNVTTSVSTKISWPKIQGREVIHVEDMKVDFNIEGLQVRLENLFNGNKVLGHTLNTFINKNGQDIIGELKENLGENFAMVFKDIMNNVLRGIPTDLWLPQD